MAADDGSGWVECGCGARHWGRFGAAGLLLHRSPAGSGEGPPAVATLDADTDEVLLQLRAPWVHQGGTWALPGGAADSHEDAVAAALRESGEEAGVTAADVDVLGTVVTTRHPDWGYTTVLASLVGDGATVRVTNPESVRLQWTRVSEVAGLDLHPAFAVAWPGLRQRLGRLVAARG